MSGSNANNHTLRLSNDNGEIEVPPKVINSPDTFKQRISSHLPQRYTVKASGEERVLICQEAPNLNVHIENGLTVSGSVARKSPSGTIFLDGAPGL